MCQRLEQVSIQLEIWRRPKAGPEQQTGAPQQHETLRPSASIHPVSREHAIQSAESSCHATLSSPPNTIEQRARLMHSSFTGGVQQICRCRSINAQQLFGRSPGVVRQLSNSRSADIQVSSGKSPTVVRQICRGANK